MMGIAKTFRALCYLDLARLYDALPAKAPERPADTDRAGSRQGADRSHRPGRYEHGGTGEQPARIA